MEPAKEGNATGWGNDGLNAKDNMGPVGPSAPFQVREAASVLGSAPVRSSAFESSAEW
jgi:hypothetical protein